MHNLTRLEVIPNVQFGRQDTRPSGFVDSLRNRRQLFRDSMASVQHYVRPDSFVSTTC